MPSSLMDEQTFLTGLEMYLSELSEKIEKTLLDCHSEKETYFDLVDTFEVINNVVIERIKERIETL